MLKISLQIHLKRYSKQQAKRRKRTVLTMESQLLQVNQGLAAKPDDEDLLENKVRLDQLLADYYDDICEAARVKSGLKYHLQGEKPTKYFSSLMKQRSEKSTITSLISHQTKTEVSFIEAILKEVSTFYASLYSSKVSDTNRFSAQHFLDSNVFAKISPEQKDFCDRPLTEQELDSALKMLSNGKAPGVDGLPCEFFKMFWNEF
jgi:hypothetical protein